MTGSPPLHLALLLVVFMSLAVPLVQLTSAPSTKRAIAVEVKEPEVVRGLMRVRWAHSPTRLAIRSGDEVISESKPEGSMMEKEFELKIPAEGIEFALSAEWPEATPDTAITLELEPDGLDARSETKWSIGNQLDEVVTFVWKR